MGIPSIPLRGDNSGPLREMAEIGLVDAPLGVQINIQNQFIYLLMVQANTCRQAAVDKMREVQSIHAEQQEAFKMCDILMTCKGGRRRKEDLKEVEDYFTAHGASMSFYSKVECKFIPPFFISIEKNYYCDSEYADVNLRMLRGMQDQINARCQSSMTMFQDFFGQYSSYLDGARTAATKVNALMMKLNTAKS